MYLIKKLYILFIGYKNFLLVYSGKTLACLLISIFSIQKAGIVKNTAHIQSPVKFLDLFLCRVKTIFINFKHLFPFLSVPIRRFTFRANTNFLLFGYPLMLTAFTIKFNDFYFHTFKYNLKDIVCQVKNIANSSPTYQR